MSTVIHLTELDLAGCRIEGLKRLPFDKGLLEGAGSLESPVIEAATPFDDLVGSWNAELTEAASLEMSAQVRVDGTWTKWYRLSRWDRGAGRSLGRQEDLWGKVEVDTLKLRGKADAFRYQVRMDGSGARKPRLSRVAVAYEDMSAPWRPSPPFEPGPWSRELSVPPRSQMEEQEKYKHDICSPTSLAMVLEFWGRKRETLAVAEAVQDREEGIYGNWPLNVAGASALGLSGQVARLPSLEDLQEEIASGRPVVVSVSFKEGELAGAPIRKTRGHLFVVIGFTPQGDVIVNDPAAPEKSSARRVYLRAEFEKAWLGNRRGLAYLLGPRFPEDLAVGVPTADLRSTPRANRSASTSDRGLSSQLLYGERVRVLGARGDWARVSALEQPLPGAKKGDGDPGYPGWVRASALRRAPLPYRPNSVVRAKRAEVYWRDLGGREQSLTLPIGALLASVAPPDGSWEGTVDKARLLDGRLVRTSSGALRALSDPTLPRSLRRDVVEAAALFLGDRYVWGGRSSQQRRAGWGVDCSGLVHLAYRSVGMVIPRDAHGQFLRARPVARKEVQPGDLIFLSDPKDAKRINHVLLYTGGDGLLESRESAGKALRTTFEERFGVPLSQLEDRAWVTDAARTKPAKRRIFFGSYLTQ